MLNLLKIPKWVLILIGVIFLGSILGYIGYMVFVAPDAAAQKTAQAQQGTQAAQGEVAVLTDTMDIIEERRNVQDAQTQITRQNETDILKSEGADESVPADVDRNGRCALRRLRNETC